MLSRVAFLTKQVPGPEGPVSSGEGRGWRLLALLVWRRHLAAGREPEPVRRSAYQADLGLAEPRSFDTALSQVHRILEAAGCADSLQETDRALVLTEDLDCDLLELLRAADRRDAPAMRRLFIFGDKTLDQLVDNIKPRKATLVWLDDLRERLESAAGPRTTEPQLALDRVTLTYLEAHDERCRALDLRQVGGSPTEGQVSLPLEDVYVSLRLGPDNPAEVRADAQVTRLIVNGRPVRLPAQDDLLALDEHGGGKAVRFDETVRTHRWVAIIGDPGAGKSTLLHWLALFHARALLARQARVEVEGWRLGLETPLVDLGPARLPVLVRVADYARQLRDDGTLPDLVDYLGLHPLFEETLPGDAGERARMIGEWLDAERAIVLVDGLDEVPDQEIRKQVATQIERFTSNEIRDPENPRRFRPLGSSEVDHPTADWPSEPGETGGNQIVVTSRRHAYKQTPLGGRFLVVEARPLDRETIVRFCRRWMLAVEQAVQWDTGLPRHEIEQRAAAAADALVAAIDADRDVRRLAANPLLLTVLALVQQASPAGELPTRRLALFEQATAVLVSRRKLTWPFEAVCEILGPFAVWLQGNRTTGYATREELETQLRTGLLRHVENPDDHIGEFIEAAHSQTGVLVETGAGLYGFAHNTFREYLAALEISRVFEDYRAWLFEHLHDVLWIEVVLMSMASLLKRPGDRIDALLREVLEQQPRLESLVHHDLRLVADCLSEIEGGSPDLVSDVVARLLRAASTAGERRLRELAGLLIEALVQLLERREAEVLPALLRALRDPRDAAVATEVLARSEVVASESLLDALHEVCRGTRRSPRAVEVRAAVAARLTAAGVAVEEDMRPIGTLFAPGAPYHQALLSLRRNAPVAAEAIFDLIDRIDPALYRIVRWVLADSESGEERGRELDDRILRRVLERLPGARGADLSSLAVFADRLAPEHTRHFIRQAFAEGRIDPGSCARLFADAPAFLPPARALGAWALSLPRQQALALLAELRSARSLLLLDVAWRELTDPSAPEAIVAAERLLARLSASFGYLPASLWAIEALQALDRRGDEHSRRVLRMIVARLRMPVDVGLQGQKDPVPLLEQLLATDAGVLGRLAAVLLAQRTQRPLTVRQYELIAQALAEDEVLSQEAARALRLSRLDEFVPEEVIKCAGTYRDDKTIDVGTRFAHMNFASASVLRIDSERAREAFIVDRRPEGRPWGEVATVLLNGADQLEDDAIESLLSACSNATKEFIALGVDPDLIGVLMSSENATTRRDAADVFAEECALRNDGATLARGIRALAEHDADTAARAVMIAASCLPDSATTEVLVELLDSVGAAEVTARTAARLAVEVLVETDPRRVLGRLDRWTISVEEGAEALLAAIATHIQWGALGLPSDLPPFRGGIVPRRIAAVTAHFVRSERAMRALIHAAIPRCKSDEWPVRRAALFLLDAAALASPGSFLREASGSGLRDIVLAMASDLDSWSVRWLVASLVSHFRELDQRALEVIAAASRDHSVADVATAERCQSLTASRDLDISALRDLLASSSPGTVLVGAGLVLTTAGIDESRRRDAIELVAERAEDDDPLLDAAADERGRTTRDVLCATLAQLIWRPTIQPEVLDAAPVTLRAPRSFEPMAKPGADEQPTITVVSRSIAWLARDETWLTLPTGVKPSGLEFADVLGRPASSPAVELLYERMLAHVTTSRVGTALSARTGDQFTSKFGQVPEHERLEWLEASAPNYGDAVREVVDKLRSELTSTAAEVVAQLEGALEPHDLRQVARNAVESLLARIASGEIARHPDAKPGWSWAMRLHELAGRLNRIRLYDEAEDVYLATLAELERTGRLGDSFEFVVLNDLGNTKLNQNETQDAIRYYERALAGKDNVRDRGHADTVTTVVNLVRAVARSSAKAAVERLEVEIAARADSYIVARDLERLEAMPTEIWYGAGARALERGDDAEAAVAFEQALAAPVFPNTRLYRALAQHGLADVLVARGQIDEAIELYEQALAAKDDVRGAVHPDTVTTAIALVFAVARRSIDEAQDRLADAIGARAEGAAPEERRRLLRVASMMWQREAQRRRDAEPPTGTREAYERALAELARLPEPDDDYAGLIAQELGDFLDRTGDVTDAAEAHARALAHRDRALGPAAGATLLSLRRLVRALARKDVGAARDRLARELQARDAQLDPQARAAMAAVWPQLSCREASDRAREADAEGARAAFERAVAELERIPAPGSDLDAIAIGDVASVALDLGLTEEAVSLHEQALAACDARGLSPFDALVALGAALERHRPKEGLRRMAAEVEARGETLGEDQMERLLDQQLILLTSVGREHLEADESSEAEHIFMTALEQLRRRELEHSTAAFVLWHDLGDAAYLDGRDEEAESRYARALAGKDATLGPGTPDSLTTLLMLIKAIARRDPERAEDRLREESERREDAIGDAGRQRLIGIRHELWHAYARQRESHGDTETAERAYRTALEVVDAVDPGNDEARMVICRDLGDVSRSDEDAMRWYALAVEVARRAAQPDRQLITKTISAGLLAQARFDLPAALDRWRAEAEALEGDDRAQLLALEPELWHAAGVAHEVAGRLAQAEESYREAMRLGDGGDVRTLLIWRDLGDVALARSDQADPEAAQVLLEEARQRYERALAAADAGHGSDSDESARTLAQLLTALDRRSTATALARFDDEVEGRTFADPAGLRVTRCVRSLGDRALHDGRAAAATAWFQRGLDLVAKGTHLEFLLWHDLGLAAHEHGDLEDAIACFERALAGKDGLGHVGHSGTVATLQALLVTLARDGRVDIALERLADERSARDELLEDADRKVLAITASEIWHAAGRVAERAGDLRRADHDYDQALAAAEAADAPERWHATIWRDLGDVNRVLGNGEEAASWYTRALEWGDASGALEPAVIVAVLSGLLRSLALSDEDAARRRLAAEVEQRAAALGPEQTQRLQGVGPHLPFERAQQHEIDGRTDAAVEHYERVLAESAQLQSVDAELLFAALDRLGTLADHAKDPERARRYFEDKLELAKVFAEEDPEAVAEAITDVVLVIAPGDPEAATNRLLDEWQAHEALSADGIVPDLPTVRAMIWQRRGWRLELDEQRFREAAAAYEHGIAELLPAHQGLEAVLWRDSGDAWQQAGETATAMVAYERALTIFDALLPGGDEEIVQTLELMVRALAADPVKAAARAEAEIAARAADLSGEQTQRIRDAAA